MTDYVLICIIIAGSIFITCVVTNGYDINHYTELIKYCNNPYYYYGNVNHISDCKDIGIVPK